MDPSTSSVPNVPEQNIPAQQVSQAPVIAAQQGDSTQPAQQTQQQKTPVTISVNKESGPAVIAVESPDTDEEEVKVAQQEAKGQDVGFPSGGDFAEQAVEVQPSVPEFAPSQEVAPFVEKSPDQEKPDLPKVVQDAGVTVSGPGVIDVKQNSFGVKKLPVTYEQAVIEEKVTELHDSKHWLMGMVIYIWRKLNPNIGKKKVESNSTDEGVKPGEVPPTVEAVEAKSLDNKND
jgi:hypothetical protein